MKSDVDFQLNSNLRKEIVEIKDVIINVIGTAQVYLFGSVAKGKYSRDSDIDLLILIQDDLNVKEIRELRHMIEDKVEGLNIDRDVDIKVYNIARYNELIKITSFEMAILKDLIDIRSW